MPTEWDAPATAPTVPGDTAGKAAPPAPTRGPYFRAVDDPFSRHAAETSEALASGDARAVRDLYRRFGTYLEEAAQEGCEVPVLSYPETAPLVLSHVPSAAFVLDAGCGPNPAVSIGLAARNAASTVVSLDIAEGSVRLARHIASSRGLEVLPVVADVERLPFREACFDAIVCDDTIEHLPDPEEGVRELARVLTDGGTAVAVTPNRIRLDVLAARGRDLLRRRRRPREHYFAAASHLREYTPQEFRSLLREAFPAVGLIANGWPGDGRRAVASALVRLPFLRRFSRLAFAIATKSP